MSLKLPAPVTTQLRRSPLQLAVCQVRYEPVLGVSEYRLANKVYRELGGEAGQYPNFGNSSVQSVSIQLSETGMQSGIPQAQQGWQFSAKDESWVVVLMPDHVSLQTTAYTAWSGDFSERLKALLHAVVQHVAPEAEKRLGLRYVNKITGSEGDSSLVWRKYVAPEFLGPLLHKTLGPAVSSAQQLLEISVDAVTRCTFRHGFLSESSGGEPTYLIDSDVYREGYRPFDQDDILVSVSAYNTVALQLFQQAITPGMLRRLGETGD